MNKSIRESIEEILNSEGTIREKTDKILHLDFIDSDVHELTTKLIEVYEETFEDIIISSLDIEPDIQEISYRNAYLLTEPDNVSKKENAVNQKEKFIRKVEKYLNTKSKGLEENEEVEVETTPPATEEKKEEVVTTTQEPYSIDDLYIKPSVITNTEIPKLTQEDNKSYEVYNPYNSFVRNDSFRYEERIMQIKTKFQAIQDDLIKRVKLEEAIANEEAKYEEKIRIFLAKLEQEKQEGLLSIEKEKQERLSTIENEIRNIDMNLENSLNSISRDRRIM